MNYTTIIRIAMFAEKIKYKHYNYNITMINLKTVILFKVSINWLDWKMIDKNNTHLSVFRFIQLEW